MLETKDKQEVRVKRAHIQLMKHPETALYSGVMLMGKTEVTDGSFTAYTDGVNKRYCRSFLQDRVKSEPKLRGLILHENLHVALKQIQRGKDMFKEDAKIANMAADFVVNDIIYNIKGTVLGKNELIVELPDGALHDEKYRNWSMREVYNDIRKQNPQRQKSNAQGGQDCDEQGDSPINGDSDSSDGENIIHVNGKDYDMGGEGFDEHDWESGGDLTHEQAKELNDKIDKALREGGILAGRMGAKLPRAIEDLLETKVDWREVLREFVSSSMRGKDEFTWRRMNKRHLANDMYMPSVENETIGEVIVAIDTSGSIGSKELTEFASELASICSVSCPEKVRVLWWDTQVHGEQVFTDQDYANIGNLLKPLGGGGTYVSSVSEHINKEKLKAECVIVFTDGYVESDIKWQIDSPTLWMVTMNKGLTVPTGKKVFVEFD